MALRKRRVQLIKTVINYIHIIIKNKQKLKIFLHIWQATCTSVSKSIGIIKLKFNELGTKLASSHSQNRSWSQNRGRSRGRSRSRRRLETKSQVNEK